MRQHAGVRPPQRIEAVGLRQEGPRGFRERVLLLQRHRVVPAGEHLLQERGAASQEAQEENVRPFVGVAVVEGRNRRMPVEEVAEIVRRIAHGDAARHEGRAGRLIGPRVEGEGVGDAILPVADIAHLAQGQAAVGSRRSRESPARVSSSSAAASLPSSASARASASAAAVWRGSRLNAAIACVLAAPKSARRAVRKASRACAAATSGSRARARRMGGFGFRQPRRQFEHPSLAVVQRGGFRLERDGGVEGCDGFVVAAQPRQAHAQGILGGRRWQQAVGDAEILERGGMIALFARPDGARIEQKGMTQARGDRGAGQFGGAPGIARAHRVGNQLECRKGGGVGRCGHARVYRRIVRFATRKKKAAAVSSRRPFAAIRRSIRA